MQGSSDTREWGRIAVPMAGLEGDGARLAEGQSLGDGGTERLAAGEEPAAADPVARDDGVGHALPPVRARRKHTALGRDDFARHHHCPGRERGVQPSGQTPAEERPRTGVEAGVEAGAGAALPPSALASASGPGP